MTTETKERIKTDLEQAKQEGKQRAERISDILKSAASMTFDEIKGGSAELNTLTRKSLAQLLDDLKEEAEVNDAEVEPAVAEAEVVAEAETITDAEASAPSWRELITHALAIVRDRKGDWWQRLKEYLSESAVKYDSDMSEEYGDRYLKAKTFVKRLLARLEAIKAQANKPSAETSAQPVNIEVIDDNQSATEVSDRGELLKSESASKQVQ